MYIKVWSHKKDKEVEVFIDAELQYLLEQAADSDDPTFSLSKRDVYANGCSQIVERRV